MKACRSASIVGAVPLAFLAVMGACRSEKPPPNVPPLTTAYPEPTGRYDVDASAIPVARSPAADLAVAADASVDPGPAPKVSFVEGSFPVEADVCGVVLVAVVKGKATYLTESADTGDVLVISAPTASQVNLSGLAVKAIDSRPCPPRARPTAAKVVRGAATPKLTWAGGTMNAWRDAYTTGLFPDPAQTSVKLYLGRLEGTAPVAEHTHPTSWEILAAIEASGTFSLDGKESRLGPRQVVVVPPGVKHAWKPDPGTKLVAIQMYAPPGPEERFVTLAAAEKDAGKP